MAKLNLTDRFIRSRKPAPAGKREEFGDAQVPGLALRVTDRGHKSFVLVGRVPAGSGNPTRRHLGDYGALTLDQARGKARDWVALIAKGLDPKAEEEKVREAQAEKRRHLTEAVAEDYFRDELPKQRKGREVERDLRRDLLSEVGSLPITEVRESHIRTIIKRKKRTAPAQARNLFGYIRGFFSWAKESKEYGLEQSPCREIDAIKLVGEKISREHTLSENELFALWRAVRRLPFPVREIYQLLALNGLRLNEVVDASTSEFDFRKRTWTIPAERMKGRNGKAREHVVPLTDASLEIIASLPWFDKGPYLFSLNFGKSPVWIGSKVKSRVDARMLLTLRAMARKRGADPSQVALHPWVNHDIRRTVRTNLSPLRNERGALLADEVKEAVVAHVRPGIKGVYDRYKYLDEKHEALELWSDALREIVEPKGGPRGRGNNVTDLSAIRAAKVG